LAQGGVRRCARDFATTTQPTEMSRLLACKEMKACRPDLLAAPTGFELTNVDFESGGLVNMFLCDRRMRAGLTPHNVEQVVEADVRTS